MSSLPGVLCVVLLLAAGAAQGQSIRNRYVAKAEQDGTIYHTLPETLFASREWGSLTFDITYKERADGRATINFTYRMPQMTPADSVCFSVGERVLMAAPVRKLFAEPGRRNWTHRYTFTTPVESLYTFFDEGAEPCLTIYSAGRTYVYPVRRSAWRSYAPVGFRIFEMIRANEQ